MIDLSIVGKLSEVLTYGIAILYGGSVVLFGYIIYKVSKRIN